MVLTDLVLSPFGADPAQMIAAAVAADAGFDGVYTYDHFSATVADQAWSRDPFVVLGAIAAATAHVRVGVLVANLFNRHPAQLASAVDTLDAIAPGRVMCGLGAGAAPGSPFAAEHELIGRPLAPADERRAALSATIAELRAIWAGTGVAGVVDPGPAPPIVVGASSAATAAVAGEHADGVNLQRGPADRLSGQIFAARQAHERSAASGRSFEVSVFDAFDADHPLGGDPAPLVELGVDRRTLWVAPPYSLTAIAAVAASLRRLPVSPPTDARSFA